MKKLLSNIFQGICAVCLFLSLGITANAATVPSNANLLNTYGSLFGKVGNAVPAFRMTDSIINNYVKPQYNSVTLENEMKPDYILGGSSTLISVSQAKALGYYIPDGYTESTVPKLNFDTVDSMLKTCYDNGLSMRAHTLVWHSQTPDWYFRSGYSAGGSYVSQAVMNKRMEFYIKTVMNHVCSSKYGSVVYAWDVVNEFLHAQNSGWQSIYGKPNTQAQFVKDAFNYAYETLEYFKLTDKVKLFYNDYNTYMEVNDVIKLINFINSGKKVCAGVGMQSHLGTSYPSVAYYKSALQSFVKAGFEVEITELDVGASSTSVQDQYYYDLMKAILEVKKAGGNISAIVWWGLCDDYSWRKDDKPLLFSSCGNAKSAYKQVLQAYFDAGYTIGATDESTAEDTAAVTVPGTTVKLEDGWYYIKNVNAQKYLQVKDNTGKAVQNVELGTGTGVSGQKWYLKNVADGYITLQSALGNFMIDIASAKDEDGANVQIYDAYSGTAQQFMLKSTSINGAYVIATKCSSLTKVLDDYNFGKEDGTNVCQWTYGGRNNQLWVFEPTTNNSQANTSNTESESTTVPEQSESAGKLALDYTINNWGSEYQVSFKITNSSSADVSTWTLKLKKSEINIASSWSVNVKEDGDYYIITPVDYNSYLTKGSSIEFGIQGNGSIGSTISYTLN